MNVEELKSAWAAYDAQLKASNRLQQEMISSMIANRSTSRFYSVRRKYLLGVSWMTVCLVLAVTVIVTNPFDYQLTVQFVPLTLFSVCLLVLIIGMLAGYRNLKRITLEKETLAASLKHIIAEYERPQRLMNYTLIVLLFTAVVLFPFSFLPAAVKNIGLGAAIAERLVPIAISTLLLYVAYRLGAFRERDAPLFKEDLTELQQLRAMSNELKAD